MIFEELNTRTRKYMLEEFRTEQLNPNPYRPKVLTPEGEAAFIGIMEEHLAAGNTATLTVALSPSRYWVETGTRYTRRGPVSYFLPAMERARVFGLTEFNTWYVRGVCRSLMEEGVTEFEAGPKQPTSPVASAYRSRAWCSTLRMSTAATASDIIPKRARTPPPSRSRSALTVTIRSAEGRHGDPSSMETALR